MNCECSFTAFDAISHNCEICFRRLAEHPDHAYRYTFLVSTIIYDIRSNSKFLRILLHELDYDPNETDNCESIEITILHRYANGDTFPMENIIYLLENGANPNFQILDNMTPFHLAVFNNNVDIVELFIKYGSDPNIKCNIGNAYFDSYNLAQCANAIDVQKILELEDLNIKDPGYN